MLGSTLFVEPGIHGIAAACDGQCDGSEDRFRPALSTPTGLGNTRPTAKTVASRRRRHSADRIGPSVSKICVDRAVRRDGSRASYAHAGGLAPATSTRDAIAEWNASMAKTHAVTARVEALSSALSSIVTTSSWLAINRAPDLP